MNLAAIIIQLYSFCTTIQSTNFMHRQNECKAFMRTCAEKHYSQQQVDNTQDACVKKYLKETSDYNNF